MEGRGQLCFQQEAPPDSEGTHGDWLSARYADGKAACDMILLIHPLVS